ncbi:glycosyltransferase family 39 protein [Flexivirga caeni]|uniref:glycosyltransferase family 39 protein n=1 Tax=Flexivirga caeni TaxID=2294115 RepID=UPI00131595DE|nr:glycosyltransferase family 39 protein [Flexivirga caeni]
MAIQRTRPHQPTTRHRLPDTAAGRTGVLLLLALAAGIALFRFRLSPLYPQRNDINSDFYVYQVVGNAWAHGQLPYRDVYDVKGPFFYLLFGGFARLRAWSVGPPLAMLAVCAFAALWLAHRIALRILGPVGAVLSALSSGALIYLAVLGVSTSFTCEELAVPGVLLMLWLVLRALDGEPVATRWWVLDGVVFGALFWAKYQVIAPWAAMLIALLVVGRDGHRALPMRELGRIVLAGLAGCAITTVVTLAPYAGGMRSLLQAYFVAKLQAPRRNNEFALEGRYAAELFTGNPIVVVTLCLALLTFLLCSLAWTRLQAETRAAAAVFAVAMPLSMWAAVVGVRHPNNVLVPLCFVAVALPMAAATLRRPGQATAVTAVVAVLAFAGVIPSMQQSGPDYGLGRASLPIRCVVHSSHRHFTAPSTAAAFVDSAKGGPILSVNSLFAARALYRTHTVPPHRFEFADLSWVYTTPAAATQLQYLRDGTFAYVWVSGARIGPAGLTFRDAPGPGVPTPAEAAELALNYRPILACGGQQLLHREDGR